MIQRSICLLALFTALSTSPALGFDQSNAGRIKELVDTGMRYYWTGGDVKKAESEVFKGITLHGKYDVVEAAFAEASKLAPERMDFRYAIASTQILQKKLDEAALTYQGILEKNPNAFEAQAWLEAIAHIKQDKDSAELAHTALAGMDMDRADAYRKRFLAAEKIMANTLNFDVRTITGKVVILTLGYALGDGGIMQQPLLDRLDVTLKAALANPEAMILVSGGVPKSGVTEGDLMMKWLVEKGIDRGRILIEDKSRDTIGNVLNAATLLTRHQADTVLLITSSSHMRRAHTLLEEALAQKDLRTVVTPLNALDADNAAKAAKVTEAERMTIYRDLMRVSGIWAYPGLQQ